MAGWMSDGTDRVLDRSARPAAAALVHARSALYEECAALRVPELQRRILLGELRTLQLQRPHPDLQEQLREGSLWPQRVDHRRADKPGGNRGARTDRPWIGCLL